MILFLQKIVDIRKFDPQSPLLSTPDHLNSKVKFPAVPHLKIDQQSTSTKECHKILDRHNFNYTSVPYEISYCLQEHFQWNIFLPNCGQETTRSLHVLNM